MNDPRGSEALPAKDAIVEFCRDVYAVRMQRSKRDESVYVNDIADCVRMMEVIVKDAYVRGVESMKTPKRESGDE